MEPGIQHIGRYIRDCIRLAKIVGLQGSFYVGLVDERGRTLTMNTGVKGR